MHKIKLLIVALAVSCIAGDVHNNDIGTDSCRTLAYNTGETCTEPLEERLRDAAKLNGLTVQEYINLAIIERIEYDEETYFFNTGKYLK